MADFSALKQSIETYIKNNGNKEITGAILQNILLSMVTTMGDGAINDNASDISDIKGDIQNINGSITDINGSITDINGDITDLNGGLSDEKNRAEGAEGTLQLNITAEKNRAEGAETTSILFSDGKLVFKNAAGTVLYQLSVDSFLSAITTRLNTGALYAGYATPSTTPATLTSQEVFYLATQAGTYTNFHFNGGDDHIVLAKDGIYFIVSGNGDDDWNAEPMLQLDDVPTASSNNPVKSGGVAEELALGAVYDVSAKNPTAGPNNDGKWESLSVLLSDANLNTIIPTSVRKGGMSIKFIQNSNNKYAQYRLMAQTFSTTESDWQGVDDEPTAGSDNLVKSGGVKNDLNCLSIDSDRYVLENYYLNKFYNDQTGKLGERNGFVMTPRLQYKKDAYIYFYSSTNYYLFSAICFDKNGTYLGVVPLGWQVDSYKWRATLGALTFYYSNTSYFNVCIYDNSSETELTPSDISSFHFELVKQNNYKDSIADIYDVLGIRNILVKPDRGKIIAYDNGYYAQQAGYNISSNISLSKGETIYVECNTANDKSVISIPYSGITLAKPLVQGIGSMNVYSYTATEDCNVIICYVESDGCRVFVTNNKKSEWQGKTWASYGDSIVQGNTWQNIVTEKLGFAKHYNRGIGGTAFTYGTAKYSLNADGSYNDGGSSNMHYGYYASWDRITNMFPASIKDTINLVVIGGGNNDINNYYMPENEIEFSDAATEDAEWISYCQANNLPVGDFGTTDYKNAIVSTIMKLQTWMPNAIIVCLSTVPTMGNNNTANQTSMISVEVYGRTNTPIMMRDAFKKAADFVSTPFIDIYSKMGVNFLNRHDYVVDGIHPNTNGGMMIARVVVGELKNILPRL